MLCAPCSNTPDGPAEAIVVEQNSGIEQPATESDAPLKPAPLTVLATAPVTVLVDDQGEDQGESVIEISFDEQPIPSALKEVEPTSHGAKSGTSRISYISGQNKGLACGDTVIDLEAIVPADKPSAGCGGEYIKSFVFGGLDGIVSTFALVAGLGGAQVAIGTLIAVSLAKVLADGFSMGFGEFTSAKAEAEHTEGLRKKEMAVMEKNLDGEVKELAGFYVERGVSQSDALTIVSLLAGYKDLFLEHVLAFQHGVLGEEDVDVWQPLKQGFVCFLAFVCFGMVPLFGFIVFFAIDGGKSTDYWVILGIAYGLTATTLFIMGVTKAKLTGSKTALKSGIMMLFNGTFAGGMAFLLGEALAGALSTLG